MNTPKVTVLMSVYNDAKYIDQAVESILNQTFINFSFLIIDDGSTDDTLQVLEQYHDNRITVIRNEQNMGLTKSLNKGLKLVQSEYIARIDADDLSEPQRLEREVEFLDSKTKVGLVGTWYKIIDETGKIIGMNQGAVNNIEIKKELVKTHPFCHSSVMFRKECLEEVGPYREEFRYTQDYDLWLRISEKHEMANIPELLCRWRVNIESISIQNKAEQMLYAHLAKELARQRKELGRDQLQTLKDRKESEKEIKIYIDSFKKKNVMPPKKVREKIVETYHGFGLGSLIQKNRQRARYLFLKSIKHDPCNIKSYIYFFLTILPFGIINVIRGLKAKLIKRS